MEIGSAIGRRYQGIKRMSRPMSFDAFVTVCNRSICGELQTGNQLESILVRLKLESYLEKRKKNHKF